MVPIILEQSGSKINKHKGRAKASKENKCNGNTSPYNESVQDTGTSSESLKIEKKSGEKDSRGKCIQESRHKFEGENVENIITIDRSKRPEGSPETNIYHEVKRDGKTIHGPHLEPKKRKAKTM